MSKKIDLRTAFVITTLCRGDINPKKYPEKFIAGLTDSDMKRIVSKMADAYCNCCFWVALDCMLENIMEERGFKRK